MNICKFVSKLCGADKYSFYLNDKIVDIAELYNNNAAIICFEIEDNVIRFYIKDNDDMEE